MDQLQQVPFKWPSRPKTTYNRLVTTAKTFVDSVEARYPEQSQDHFQYHPHHEYDQHPTTIRNAVAEDATMSFTDSNLGITNMEVTETTLGGILNNITSNISSIATTSDVGLKETIATNQTVTESLLDIQTTTGDLLQTISSNISAVTPDIGFREVFDTSQTSTQSTVGDLFATFSSNITSITPGIIDDVNTNQNFTTVLEGGLTVSDTTVSSIITTVSSNVPDLATEEITITVSSIANEVTETVMTNISEILTTTGSTFNSSENNKYDNEFDNSKDVVLYIVLGLVIALLIIIVILFYIFCKKCKSRYTKSGDYFVTRYTTSTSC